MSIWPGLPHGPGDHCPVEPSGTSACWLTRQVSAAVPPEALRDEIRGAMSWNRRGDRLADLLEFNDFLRPTAVLILFYSGLKVRPPAHRWVGVLGSMTASADVP